jgi:hypothetical protein
MNRIENPEHPVNPVELLRENKTMNKPRLFAALALCAYAVSIVTVFGFDNPQSAIRNPQSFTLCLVGNAGNFVIFSDQTGGYIYYCGGAPIASGTGALTRRGSFGRIVHVKGDRTVWIQWDTAAGGGVGAGYAYVLKLSSGVSCSITDTDMKHNNCGL